jgi:hypothetical protein
MSRCGNLGGVSEHSDFHGASAGRTAPPVGPLSAEQQPATKADLYAAVDALRADMRELLDQSGCRWCQGPGRAEAALRRRRMVNA